MRFRGVSLFLIEWHSFDEIDFANINIKNKKGTIKNDIITLFSDEKCK